MPPPPTPPPRQPSAPPSDADTAEAMLSPQDGTFGQRYVPDEVHVPNAAAQAGAKEREAREDARRQDARRRSSSSRDEAISQWASSSRGSWRGQPFQPDPLTADNLQVPAAPSVAADDQASVMTHPPPAYSDVAQSINGRSRPSTAYYTMGAESERFFPAGTPQDLGGDAEDQPLLGGARAKRSWPASCAGALKLLFVAVFIMLGVGFAVNATRHVRGRDESVPVRIHPGLSEPVPVVCPLATMSASADVRVHSPKTFSFEERAVRYSEHFGSSYSQLRIRGQLSVRNAARGDDATARMELHFQSTDQEVLDLLEVHQLEDKSVRLLIPEWEGRSPHGLPPCLVVTGTIWVHPDADLSSFSIYSEHLDMAWEAGTSFAASTTELIGQLGDVSFHGGDTDRTLSGRELRIDTRTGSVRGEYPLLDLLSISTSTGSVDVVVDPKPAGPDDAAAVLQVETWTGSVKLDTPALRGSALPDRDYRASVESHTGSIDIKRLPHGSRTALTSSTSSIRATLFPHGGLGHDSLVSAITNTGSVEVGLMPHVNYPKHPMRKLSGQYRTTTGSVRLLHPLQWEGSLHAETTTGGVRIDWPGMSYQDRRHKSSSFTGSKGEGDGTIEVSARTGSITLTGQDL